MECLGINNRNPLNVKQTTDPDDPWDGSRGSDHLDHAVFLDPVYSVRAACRCLARKCRTMRTWREIFGSYAPASDGNDPGAYASFVANRAGSHTDGPANLFDKNGEVIDRERLETVLEAMIEFENYAGYEICGSTIRAGIAMYLRDFVTR